MLEVQRLGDPRGAPAAWRFGGPGGACFPVFPGYEASLYAAPRDRPHDRQTLAEVLRVCKGQPYGGPVFGVAGQDLSVLPGEEVSGPCPGPPWQMHVARALPSRGRKAVSHLSGAQAFGLEAEAVQMALLSAYAENLPPALDDPADDDELRLEWRVEDLGPCVPEDSAGDLRGAAAVGRKVGIWWPEDACFYYGQLTDFDAADGTHTVLYDLDAVRERLLLDDHTVEFVRRVQPAPPPAPRPPRAGERPPGSLPLPPAKKPRADAGEPEGPPAALPVRHVDVALTGDVPAAALEATAALYRHHVRPSQPRADAGLVVGAGRRPGETRIHAADAPFPSPFPSSGQ